MTSTEAANPAADLRRCSRVANRPLASTRAVVCPRRAPCAFVVPPSDHIRVAGNEPSTSGDETAVGVSGPSTRAETPTALTSRPERSAAGITGRLRWRGVEPKDRPLGAVLVGRVSDRVGRRVPFLAMTLLTCTATALERASYVPGLGRAAAGHHGGCGAAEVADECFQLQDPT